MDGGSSWERGKRDDRRKGEEQGFGLEHKIEPFVPRKGHDPTELRSWAKRTGFVSTFSGESERSLSVRREFDLGRNVLQNDSGDGIDLEKVGIGKTDSASPKIEIDPVLGRTQKRRPEIVPVRGNGRPDDGALGYRDGRVGDERETRIKIAPQPAAGSANVAAAKDGPDGNDTRVAPGVGASSNSPVLEQKTGEEDSGNGAAVDRFADGEDAGGNGGWYPSPRMAIGLKDNPGYVSSVFYGFQHYLSLAGSLIFIPLIIVPAMGGTDKDTSSVISTMLLLSGITTILHSYFGTRLPLVQGSSFVYLAPALVIINSREFRELSENRFGLTMRELQGAIIIGSLFQCIIGFSGLMSLLLRLINPVVVAPTVAAVGLAFFSYGFPQAGACVEISVPEILLILLFTLYLRGVSVFGNRVFRIYAVPLSVVIIWAYAFFLTAGGAYNFKGCSPDIPSSNVLNDSCKRHAYTMKHCRTDVSDAMRTAQWIRIPYPLQWGIPIFRLRTSLLMIFVSLVASIESVGTYHTASIRVNAKTPTPGTVSRGIAIEGFCSLLAGLWGSGTGSSTLIENVHTISSTKVASRKVVVVGSAFMIVFSLTGKIGAILASIPQALAAAVLCFMWALVVALGLSTLQYTKTASFRNITIVGVSLFLGLSIPAFVQQYPPVSSLVLPSYLIPYSAASDGPVRTGSKEVDFMINGVLSLNAVMTLLIAFALDNTVPGSKEERGVYVWSSGEEDDDDPSSLSDYRLPGRIASCFRWAKCLDIR